ncbi:hypothetical protein HY992_04665 [Candidatus Micrarchaeota archaeon]|nr:hypothetical protein [Candidatus Micrarchaeota archaeon]
MAVVKELVDFFSKMNFYKMVYEYQQGLYFRTGRALFKRMRGLSREEELNAWKREKEVIERMGRAKFLPFRRPKLPEGFRRDWVTGLPLHESRMSRVLKPGLYFHVPIVEDIVVDSIQERVLNLGNITVLTSDADNAKPISVSCNLRYKVVDFYRAYTAVHDYEESLKDYTLSMLAKYSRGKTMKEWQDAKTIREIERKVERRVRNLVTEQWGLEIHKAYITDNVPSDSHRIVLDGQPINLTHKMHEVNASPQE